MTLRRHAAQAALPVSAAAVRVVLVALLACAPLVAGAQNALGASAPALAFGSTAVGASNASSNPASSTITNNSTTTVTISGIGKSGTNAAEFTAVGTCVGAVPVQLAPAASCTLGATFAPTAVGTRTAVLTVQSNASTNPSINLSGTATTMPSATLALSRNVLAFPTQTISTTSAAQDVNVRNTGTAPLTITQVVSTPMPEFTTSSTCIGTVLPGGSCSIVIVFTPSAAGARSGSVMITASTGPETIMLSGNSVLTPTAIVTPTDTSLALGSVQVGGTPPTKATQIANSGNAPLQINAVAIQGPNAAEFALSSANTCSSGALAALAECRLDVEFRPQTAGSKTASVALTHNGPGGSTTIALSATATAAPAPPPAASKDDGGGGAMSLAGLLALLTLGAATARGRMGRR